MKFAAIFALTISGASAFAPSMVSRSATSLDGAVVYYSTSTGNTETVAQYIADAAGGLDIVDIGDASDDEIKGFDGLIIGAPTWHTGADEQRSGTSWDDFLYDTLPNIELQICICYRYAYSTS